MHSIVFEMYCVTFSDNPHTPFISLKFLTFAGFFVLVAFIQTYEMAWKMNGKLLIESVPLYVRRVCAWKVCLLCEKLANFPPFCNGCCDMGLGLFCAFNMRICFWHGSSFFFVVALSLYHQFHSFIIFDVEKCGFCLLFVHYVWVCGFVRSITITGATAAKHDCVCILIYGFFVVPKWTAQTVLSTCIFWPESNWIKLCVKWQHSQRVNEQARWLYPMCFAPTTANPMAHCGCVVQLFKGNY